MSESDSMRRSVRWEEIVLPDSHGRDGLIRATLTFRPRRGGEPLQVAIEARSEAGGWPVTARSKSGQHPSFTAGLVAAVVRSKDGGRLTITWPRAVKRGVPRDAEVSDLPALLSDARAQRAFRALYGELPALGRPPGQPNALRHALVAELRARANMTDEEVDRRGVELGIWADMRGDYDVIGKRVGRLRKDSAGQ